MRALLREQTKDSSTGPLMASKKDDSLTLMEHPRDASTEHSMVQ